MPGSMPFTARYDEINLREGGWEGETERETERERDREDNKANNKNKPKEEARASEAKVDTKHVLIALP